MLNVWVSADVHGNKNLRIMGGAFGSLFYCMDTIHDFSGIGGTDADPS